jgi:hypothetical protein
MAKADSVLSTPPTNTPISQVDATSRRRFLSNAAGIAAGGTVLALATIPPAPAVAAPASPLDPANASPALRAAAIALDEAHERLEAAKARFITDDAKVSDWVKDNPEPAKGRARKRWARKWNEYRDATVFPSWAVQIEAEEHFRTAQMAVAKIGARDIGELALKAAISCVYDKVRLAGGQKAVIGYSVALNLISLTTAVTS